MRAHQFLRVWGSVAGMGVVSILRQSRYVTSWRLQLWWNMFARVLVVVGQIEASTSLRPVPTIRHDCLLDDCMSNCMCTCMVHCRARLYSKPKHFQFHAFLESCNDVHTLSLFRIQGEGDFWWSSHVSRSFSHVVWQVLQRGASQDRLKAYRVLSSYLHGVQALQCQVLENCCT